MASLDTQTITLNQNAADCIKSITGFGSTTYQNICSGASSVVPWGTVDWTICVLLIVGATVLIGLFASMIFMTLWG